MIPKSPLSPRGALKFATARLQKKSIWRWPGWIAQWRPKRRANPNRCRMKPSAAPSAPGDIRYSAQLGITIQTGLREIWAHKFRSLLTMLGIILGVSSLVAMSALVAGMEKGAKEALIAIGGLQKVRVEPQDLPIDQRHLVEQAVGITINDVFALEQSAPLVTRLSPEMRLPAAVSANGKTFRPWYCGGVWPI